MRLGAIADDFTGATDLCSSLRRGGRRCRLLFGADEGTNATDADVTVVALKSRTAPVADAVADSLAALGALERAGADQIYFKYCSTFDSTAAGNIGPVLDALGASLGAPTAVVCPAHPEQGRTVYRGHLFVGDALLSDSPMATHPLTPMRDANLLRLLAAQSTRPVGLLPITVVEEGAAAVRRELAAHAAAGRYVVADAYAPRHLDTLAAACAAMPLVSGGAGLGAALGTRGRAAEVAASSPPAALPGGRTVVLAGSASAATRAQVEHARARMPHWRLDPLALAAGTMCAADIAAAVLATGGTAALVSAGGAPEEVAAAQHALGTARASALIEGTLAEIARLLFGAGVRRFVAAGGETAAAVVQGLGLREVAVGDDLEPGVPWLHGPGADPIALALKSGNFGSTSLFSTAVDRR